jgi:hypothetical protein
MAVWLSLTTVNVFSWSMPSLAFAKISLSMISAA